MVTLHIAECSGQVTTGRLLPASLEVVNISYERKVCSSLAIQEKKKKKEYQSDSSKWNCFRGRKKNFREILTLDEDHVFAPYSFIHGLLVKRKWESFV